jgi:hypothetical protein
MRSGDIIFLSSTPAALAHLYAESLSIRIAPQCVPAFVLNALTQRACAPKNKGGPEGPP